MANKLAQQFLFNYNRMMTMIDLRITFGAAGAVDSFEGNAIQDVVKDATGRYTITLKQPFNAFLSSSGQMIAAVPGTPTNVLAIEMSGDPDAGVQNASVSIHTLDAAGALVDPASGAKLSMQLMVRNSSVSK